VSDSEPSKVLVRRVQDGDIEALVGLMPSHARYERSTPPRATAAALRDVLLSPDAPIRCWVAINDDHLVGYCTTTIDWSTWHCERFVYLDTLFVDEDARSHGTGAALLAAVVDDAKQQRITTIEWQTPSWNIDAARFYERHGATSKDKLRFVLDATVHDVLIAD
jgi:GNAT superfamily N-acetyltransferase